MIQVYKAWVFLPLLFLLLPSKVETNKAQILTIFTFFHCSSQEQSLMVIFIALVKAHNFKAIGGELSREFVPGMGQFYFLARKRIQDILKYKPISTSYFSLQDSKAACKAHHMPDVSSNEFQPCFLHKKLCRLPVLIGNCGIYWCTDCFKTTL